MPEPEQTAVISSAQRYWWAEAWAEARPRFIATSTEIIVSVGLLLALAIFYLSLRLLIVAGVPAEGIEFLERADLWSVKAVFLTFSLGFVLQSVMGSYALVARSRNSIREKS